MHKTYISPSIYAIPLVGCKALLEGSILIDDQNPVEDPDDIGFAKEKRGGIWDDDWDD